MTEEATIPPAGARLRTILESPAFRSVLGGLLCALLSIPLLWYHFAWDQGAYATIADKLLNGGIAYRDAWEFRPPGGFYAYYAAFLVFGRSEWAVRALEVVALGLSGAGLVVLGERRFGSRRSGMISALALPFLYLPFGHWWSADPESFQMPWIIWGLAIWPLPEDSRRVFTRCAAAGLLLGAAVIFKTPAVLTPGILMLERLVQDIRKPSWKEKLQATLATFGGLVILPAAVIGYYAYHGVLRDLKEAVLDFGPNYVRNYGGDFSLQFHAARIPDAIRGCLPFWSMLLVVIGIVRMAVVRRGPLVWWTVLFLVSLEQLAMQTKYMPYHGMVMLPFLAMGIGMAWTPVPEAADPVRWRRILLKSGAWAALLVGGIATVELISRVRLPWADVGRPPEHQAFHDGLCWRYHEDSARLARAIQETTQPGDRIFIWSNTPLPYFLSGRLMAGPYSSLFLITAPWVGDEGVRRLMIRLDQERPKLIVLGANDSLWEPADSRELLRRHPAMREYLGERYRRIRGFEQFQFWMRID